MSAFMLTCRRAVLPALFAVLLCALPALADGSARTLPLKLETGARAVDSCMDWLLDATGSLSVEEAASETMRDRFKALRVVPFAKEAGSLWLRFTLPAKSADDLRPATLMLDMGPGVPGSPTLYVPRVNPADRSVQWQAQQPRQGAVFVLPEAGAEPQTCYISLPGVPGPWLSPMLRSPHDAATALERMAHPAVLVALGIVILLCLLRSGPWHIWAALYSGAALAHAWYGAPLTPAGHIEMNQAAAVIAPGLALMLLPHVGRQFMHTARFSRMIDSQYMLLSLPGVLLILLPLVPNFAWTARLLPLWPLGTLLLVPTTLGAWMSGMVGARRFLLGCLLPPIGVAVGLGLPAGMVPPDLLASAPMWAVALGMLIVAGSATVPLPQADADALPHMDGNGLELAPRDAGNGDDIMTLDAPLPAAADALPHMPAPADDLHMDTPAAGASPHVVGKDVSRVSDALRLHLDSVLHQAAALRQAPLPSGPRRQAEQLEQALRAMQALLGDAPAPRDDGQEDVFNLQRLLRDVHGRAQEAAEGNNTALSWYMPPHMGLWYKGNATLIGDILDMLVCSAVQATEHGAIQIAVRRMPESVDPGHLFFTITDTGSGLPPHNRPALALVRAWETAGAHHGSLSMECGPRGTSVSFSLHLTAVRQDGATMEPDAASVLIVNENPANRQLISYLLEGVCATREARTPAEAVERQAQAPAALMIMNGKLDAAGMEAVRTLRRAEQETGAAPALLLALIDDDSQWPALRDAGFSQALPTPVTRKALRGTVRQLLAQAAPAEAAAAPAEAPVPDLFGAPAEASATAAQMNAETEQTPTAEPASPQASAGIPDLFGTAPAPAKAAAKATDAGSNADMLDMNMDTASAPRAAASPVPPAATPDLFGTTSAPAVENTPAAMHGSPAATPDLFGTAPAPRASAPDGAANAMPSLHMDTAAKAAAKATDAGSKADMLDMNMDTASAPRAAASPVPPAATPDLFGAAPAPRTSAPDDAANAIPSLHMDTAADVPPLPAQQAEAEQTDDDALIFELSAPLETVPAAPQAAPAATAAPAMPAVNENASADSSATAQPAPAEMTAVPPAAPSAPKISAARPAPLRDHEAEPYVPDHRLKMDPDALRDPAIRLLKPTAADRLSAATAPHGPKLEMDGDKQVPTPAARKAALLTTLEQNAATAEDAAAAAQALFRPAVRTMPSTPEPSAAVREGSPAYTPASPVAAQSSAPAAPVTPAAPTAQAMRATQGVSTAPSAMQSVPAGQNGADTAPSMPAAPAQQMDTAIPQGVRVISAAEVRRSQTLPQESFSAVLPEPAEAQDPVSAALQRVKALLGARAKQPRPMTPETEADEDMLLPDMPVAAPSAPRASSGRPAAAPLGQAASSAPLGQAASAAAGMPAGAVQTPVTAPAQAAAPVASAHVAPQPQQAWAEQAASDDSLSPAAPAAPADVPVEQTRASRYDPFDGLDEPIRQMLLTLDVNIVRARQAFQSGNTRSVRLLAAGIAKEAEKRGLRVLSRMGRCVESAAAAADQEALADLLPELENAVERNRIAFTSEK